MRLRAHLLRYAVRRTQTASWHLPVAPARRDAIGIDSAELPPVRVLLLDDHDGARGLSVARLGQHPSLEVVGEAAESGDALQLAQTLRPDAVLVETRRLDKRGLEAISLLASLDKQVRPAIVAYVEILHRGDWPHARAAGADDVLLREMRPEAIARELQAVVHRVHDGARYASESAASGENGRETREGSA